MANHKIIRFPNGTQSISHAASGEVMHSSIGPWNEACQLYRDPARLAELLGAGTNSIRSDSPLVLFDVGLGIAANALAAITEVLDFPATSRPLEIHSFESDLDGLRLALEQPADFPFLVPHLATLSQLLLARRWQSTDGRIDWHLWTGDFRTQFTQAPPPELIFYDFYPPDSCPELWGLKLFESIYQRCVLANRAARLLTYSSATPVRAALLAAGFYVGEGPQTEAKKQTTEAVVCLGDLRAPLPAAWLQKYARSSAQLPSDWPESSTLSERDDAEAFRLRIRSHPQFRLGAEADPR